MQDLSDWVRSLSQEQLLGRALDYLEKKEAISSGARSSAKRSPDFGESHLLSCLKSLDQTESGRRLLEKLRNQVRQWRFMRRRAEEGAVTRKVVLSPDGNRALGQVLSSPGVTFTASGLIEHLLLKEAGLFLHEKDLLKKGRAELNEAAARKAAELKDREFRLAQRKERLMAREEEVEKWRKLKSLGLKASKDMAIGSTQEIVLRLGPNKDGKRDLEVYVESGSEKLRNRVNASVYRFLREMLSLIED